MKLNGLVLQTILKHLPMSLRKWSEFTNIGVATLSGWKNGTHMPREDSLRILVDCLDKILDEEQRENLYEEIAKAIGIDERSMQGQKILEKFRKNSKEFWTYMLLEYDEGDNYYADFLNVDFHLVDEIVGIKLERWLNFTGSMVCKWIELGKEGTAFQITMKNGETDPRSVVFSYAFVLEDVREVRKRLEKIRLQERRDVFCRIYFTVKEVNDEEYERFLLDYGIYLKQISREDIKPRKVNDGFVNISSETESKTLQRLNAVADVLFRQMVDSFYLVYKEMICCQYDYSNVDEYFFQTNAGIGEYPYTVRRAISFEKNLIEGVLRKETENGKRKLDLVMDLNCLGGIYGMRLNQYARAVICVDTSRRALETIQETVKQYNKRKSSQNPGIVNIETKLMRTDTYEIMGNRNLKEKADCIILGLGSLSFVRNPDLFLKKVGNWLKKDGYILISCYNANALSILLKRYDNLNYWYDFYNHRLIYSKGQTELPVPIRLYSFREFIRIVSKYFEVKGDNCRSYPVISSILSAEQYHRGMDIIKEVDKASAAYSHQKLAYGNYNILEAINYQSRDLENAYFGQAGEQMDVRKKCKEIRHAEFVSTDTMFRYLSDKGIYIEDNFVKCVILKDNTDKMRLRYFFIVLPWHRRLNLAEVERHYQARGYRYNKNHISLCSEKELRQIGFSVGSICPFSYSTLRRRLDMELLYDSVIGELEAEFFYTYAGKCSMTYRIAKKDFMEYLETEGAENYRLSI